MLDILSDKLPEEPFSFLRIVLLKCLPDCQKELHLLTLPPLGKSIFSVFTAQIIVALLFYSPILLDLIEGVERERERPVGRVLV